MRNSAPVTEAAFSFCVLSGILEICLGTREYESEADIDRWGYDAVNDMMEWLCRSSETLKNLIHLWIMCEDVKRGRLLFIVLHIFSKYVLCYFQ